MHLVSDITGASLSSVDSSAYDQRPRLLSEPLDYTYLIVHTLLFQFHELRLKVGDTFASLPGDP
jgi:hypothetical protein